ncbi:MAG: hypothetical protein JNL01_03265 [Bdellovibrionales bacterium]|nr:hypothetical protein [Bdellovibrionales bacterium]
MWDYSGSSGQFKKRRYIERRSPEKVRSETFVMKRLGAQIRVVTNPTEGIGGSDFQSVTMILNDFSELHAKVFSKTQYIVGQEVALHFKLPKSVYVRGKIASCTDVVLSPRVISGDPHPYRLVIDFSGASEIERRAISQILKGLQNVLESTPEASAAA